MKKLRITLRGTSPLIEHSPKCVNPLHPIAKEMKSYTSKRKKTEEDLQKISDLEWEAGVYWDDNIGLVIPNECLAATVQDYDKLKTDVRFRDVRSVCVMRARVIRTRPRFNTWSCEFELMFDETKIDADTVIMAIENAGNYVGLCEMRTMGYGRFAAAVEEIEFAA